MWIRMGTFAVKPSELERLKQTYNGVAVPKVRACAGNLGCLLLEPATVGEPFSVITIWETRAAAEAYDASGAAGEVVALVRDCFAGPPVLNSYLSESNAGLPR
ncbi:MAG TPA: antibiotic biosynthesis monooxygenase [Polyangiaceae bacterium]|jgi:quinol monooxygenase YgiN|nr:antibiotic biosynthesis monooxygenase [Polyangiaceae bacterium]